MDIDVRPIALAIAKGFVRLDASTDTIGSTAPLTVPMNFFDARNGMTIGELRANTESRTRTIPRRKVDVQHRNLNRVGDPFLSGATGGSANGLVLEYGSATWSRLDTSLARLRQEVFRRPLDLGNGDVSVMNNYMPGFYVDREAYATNTNYITLFRYFLEPLGVSVDKWSMGVRGRSRTYAFADVFEGARPYTDEIADAAGASLVADGSISDPTDANQVIAAVNRTLAAIVLPDANQIPTYTDIQRILNKSCIECHGGLNYPPYSNYGAEMDFSEDENPPTTDYFARFQRSYEHMMSRTSPSAPDLGAIYRRITRSETLSSMMPFEGPPLSKVDIETIRRWIVGGRPNTVGDPHIRTVNGVNYDFQAVGEFVFQRDVSFEMQVRQAAVNSAGPLAPDDYTGLTSCVSVNSAVAMRIGRTRVTYQPDISGQPNSSGLQLRVDGQIKDLASLPLTFPSGGRLLPTIAPGGIQVELTGGSVIVITPGWWEQQKISYLNIDGRNVRATEGLMGLVTPGNWLPAKSDGRFLGPRPLSLEDRHNQLYKDFGKSWRVTDQSSMFDYDNGKTTKSFTIEDWPNANPEHECKVQEGVIGGSFNPQEAITLEAATELCKDIVDLDRRTDAIRDVMTTGERGFAKTYLLADQIEQNILPTPPTLVFPRDDAQDVPVSFDFQWEASTDGDGDQVVYRHYVWSSQENPNNNLAEMVPRSFAKNQAKKSVDFIPGRTYYWKVIVEDGKGGTVESETRQFQIKHE